ncbi:MAG TPA: histidine kinase [Mucilaginibacter sp.]
MIKPSQSVTILIIILIAASVFNPVFSQPKPDKKIDSLKTAISKHPAKDSILAGYQILLGHLIIRTDLSLAMKVTDEAIETSRACNWENGIYTALRQKGAIYYEMSEFDQAINYQLLALKEIEKAQNVPLAKQKKFAIGIYINIANSYTGTRQYDKSLEYGLKALPLTKELKEDYLEAVSYLSIGLVYLDKGTLDKAGYYLDSSYYVAQKFNYSAVKPLYYNDKGEVLTKRGKYSEAIKLFQKGIMYADSLGDILSKISCLAATGEAYFYLKDYTQAEKNTKNALLLAQQSQVLQREFESHELLSRIYQKENRPVDALESYKKYIVLRDSSIGVEKKLEISRREMQYETDKKETLSKAEIQRQKIIKNTIVAGSAILLILVLAIFFFYKKRRDAVLVQKELEFKAQVSDIEMKVLRLQLNPHFIFNSLNSISNYISKNDTKTADYFLAKFASLMRSTLESSEEKEISLTDELKMIELYIQLEAARMNNKFTYQIEVAKDINPDTTFVPPLILQPFVENSIWHGLAEKGGEGHIRIEVTRDNTLLNCVVTDDGIGRSAKPKSGKKSFGFKITADRIALLNKLKNTNASVHLVDLEKGTRVEVKLPFETEAGL